MTALDIPLCSIFVLNAESVTTYVCCFIILLVCDVYCWDYILAWLLDRNICSICYRNYKYLYVRCYMETNSLHNCWQWKQSSWKCRSKTTTQYLKMSLLKCKIKKTNFDNTIRTFLVLVIFYGYFGLRFSRIVVPFKGGDSWGKRWKRWY